jgi:speckle-type POZ protein
VFEIAGYSLHKGIGRGKSLRSAAFSVGGYKWRIHYYPDGCREEESEGYVSIFIKLLNKAAEVRALYALKLVEPVTGKLVVVFSCKAPVVFNSVSNPSGCWGSRKFMKRIATKESAHLQDDRLVIECDLEVMEVQLPSSSLSDNLAKLLLEKKGADVTFSVQGEVFPAHKSVLAMRSPVFDADFYGPMGDKERQDITAEDMQPDVFKAFLHFIYMDSMPSMDDLDADEKREMAKHLLLQISMPWNR